MSSKLRSA